MTNRTTITIWLGFTSVIVGAILGSVMVVVLGVGLIILTRLEELR